MHEITDKYKCSGCHACYNICPSKCIEMKADEDGFMQPFINESLCIDCGLCKKICPINNEYNPNPKGNAYACMNKDETVRLDSSSGGIFSLLALHVLENNGIVFGAAFDRDTYSVSHIGIDKVDDLPLLRGSKYIQSIIGDSYNLVKKHLENGRLVLFSGTPCQISGLKSFLGHEFDNLIMVDIVCHGVPSFKVWNIYMKHLSKVMNSKIDTNTPPSFRQKSDGWKNYKLRVNFEKQIQYSKSAGQDSFMRAFINNLSLRMSCYNCHSKSIERESDITLGDFWGIENIMPDMFDDKGTSLVLVNSEKGEELFKCVSSEVICKPVDINVAAKYNSSIHTSSKYTPMREKFMKEINEEQFEAVVNRYTRLNPFRKVVKHIKKLLKI